MNLNEKEAVCVLKALDDLSLALPKKFHWPLSLRRAYENAIRLLEKKSTPK